MRETAVDFAADRKLNSNKSHKRMETFHNAAMNEATELSLSV